MAFETDVNGAALAEYRAAFGQLKGSLAYITVGTGVGGGLVVNGECVNGAAHPEMGHILPRRPEGDTGFAGTCPHHGDCLEGLASGPAIMARWGKSLSDLPPDHAAHSYVSGYLAQLCHTIFATLAVEKVVMGGGVMNTPGLIERVREQTHALGADYLPGRSKQGIAAPLLGQDAGICGALLLAQAALEGAS